jgi:hypothetical protein
MDYSLMEIAIFVTAIAALVTGIANVFMIFEMKGQRKAISSPVLKIIGKVVSAEYKEDSWNWKNVSRWGLNLRLNNFGAGSAINISVNWLVDMSELLKATNQSDDKVDSNIDGMLKIGDSFHNIKLQSTKTFYAIPAYDKEEVNQLFIPKYYLCAFEEFLKVKVFNNENSEWPLFPRIVAEISCEDVNGKRCKKKYELAFNVIAFGGDNHHKTIDVKIEVKEL